MSTETENVIQKCICGSTNIRTSDVVGSDVDASGEETQYIDICQDCKAWRFNIDRYHNFSEYQKHYGKWEVVGSGGYDFIHQLPV